MTTILAYILVILLVNLCFSIGTLIAGFPCALLLAWSSMSVRTKIAGFAGGVAGIALAMFFSYGVFRFLVGPSSFTFGAFVASTAPLLISIRRDYQQALRVKAARQSLLTTVKGEAGNAAMVKETETAHMSLVAGEVVGLILAAFCFIGGQV